MTTVIGNSRARQGLDLLVAVVLLTAGGLVIWRNWPGPPPGPPLPDDPIPMQGAAVVGEPSARLAVIEYADYECPYCRQFALTVWPALERKYVRSGQVRWIFKNFPMERIHQNAMKAAEAAECARRQSRFPEMHDQLFKAQGKFSGEAFIDIASALGLDVKTFTSCLTGDAADQVRADIAEATAIDVSGTPTFFIGRTIDDARVAVLLRLSGAPSSAEFERAIDKALRPAVDLRIILAAVILTAAIIGVVVWTARSPARGRRAGLTPPPGGPESSSPGKTE